MISDLILKRTGRHRLARSGVVFISLLGAAAFLIPCLFVADLTAIVLLLAVAMFFLELTIARGLRREAGQYDGLAGLPDQPSLLEPRAERVVGPRSHLPLMVAETTPHFQRSGRRGRPAAPHWSAMGFGRIAIAL
jgi:hypothetical protein